MGKAKSGSTLLHEATLNGHSEVVAWLLDAGADVEAETDGGCAALHMAVQNGNVAAFYQLLERN
jgi:ankyrin repeat protein